MHWIFATIVKSCAGKIFSFLAEVFINCVKPYGAYVIQYKDQVELVEEEIKRLLEIKMRIQKKVDKATDDGKVIVTEVNSWLEEVKQMEVENIVMEVENIVNFLRPQENGEQIGRDFAKFLLQQENGEQMGQDVANFLRQQENGQQMERDFANFLRQQENGEQMERDFANFPRQQENGESVTCIPGCMCPNLMWRYKRGMEADKKHSNVIELIIKGEKLEGLPVGCNARFQWQTLFRSPEHYTEFGSRASVVDGIKNALKDSGVDMIGVRGPGGAGKTTMVKEVAKEAKQLGIFDEIVIAVVSKDQKISEVQEDLAVQLDLKYEQTSVLGRAGQLRNALLNGTRKILVILDDLWQVLNLTDTIGIHISDLRGKGCKILLTSRREEVFKGMGVHSHFSIGYLEEDEAWELFIKVTGDLRVDELIAKKVSKKCGCLPIAIVAVGAALKDREVDEWRTARHNLKKRPVKYIEGIHPKGYTSLKWTYEFLQHEDAKSCFLLCCLFPEDAEIDIDDLVKYSFSLGFLKEVNTLKAARNIVRTMVEVLKRSYLLLNGARENFVKMHVIIRDLAISITEEKQGEHGSGNYWAGQQRFMIDHNTQKCSENDAKMHHTAISLRINDDNFFDRCGVLDCPLAHTLVLEHGNSSNIVPNGFFQCMNAARVLDLKSISLQLPSSVLELKLQMLRLSHCKLLGDLTKIQELKNRIKILSFEGSTIKKLPQEIRELTILRSLDLRGCKSLKVIPNGIISNLRYLEELHVTVGFQGWETTVDDEGMSNASIAELKFLKKLTVLHVGIGTESLRIIMQECPHLFEKLINFTIFINFPKDLTFCAPTVNVLSVYDIHRGDDEFHLLRDKVNELRVRKISHLKGAFKDRKDLSIRNRQDFSFLLGKPQCDGGSFSKLTFLNISGCDGMKYLFSPSCARALQLETLIVINCSNMEQIIVVDHRHEEEVAPEEAIVFSRLEHLTLQGLPQFRSFYRKIEKTSIERNLLNSTPAAESIFDEKVFFPTLMNLVIDELPVENIWNKQAIQSLERSNNSSFSQLEMIFVVSCDNLVNVFPSNMLPRLKNLEVLHVRKCSSLAFLVEDLILDIQSSAGKSKFNDVFPSLRNHELDNLPKLMKT